MFHDWLKLLANLSANNYCTKDFICPECGKKSIDYRYVGDVSTRIGYLPIWCKNCSKGIQISRVEIPQEVKMIEFGDLVVNAHKVNNGIHPVFKCKDTDVFFVKTDSIENTIPNFKHVMD